MLNPQKYHAHIRHNNRIPIPLSIVRTLYTSVCFTKETHHPLPTVKVILEKAEKKSRLDSNTAFTCTSLCVCVCV